MASEEFRMNLLANYLSVVYVWIQIIGAYATPPQQNYKICEGTQNQKYSYQGANGPANWPKLFPQFCAGSNQSPINIRFSTIAPSRTPLVFQNYDQPITEGEVVNTGLTAQVTSSPGVTRAIQGGDLPSSFNLSEIHFHWGKKSDRGSEHQISGKKFSLEMHIVHSNTENMILVVGVLFREQSRNNPNMDPIISALQNVEFKNERKSLASPLNMSALLPVDKSHYRYNGSLTTPKCSEGVRWVVFRRPLRIGSTQMKAFRRLIAVERSKQAEVAEETAEVAEETAGVAEEAGEGAEETAGEIGEVAEEAAGEAEETAGETEETAYAAQQAAEKQAKETARTKRVEEYNDCALVDNFRPIQPLNGRRVFFYQK